MFTFRSTWGARARRAKVAGGVVVLAVSGLVAGLALTGPAAAGGDDYDGGWPTQVLDDSGRAAAQRSVDGDGEVIRVRSRELRAADVDVDGDGNFDPGDSFVFEERLLDARTGDKVGRDAAECGLIVNQFYCEATFLFDGRGKLVIAGALFRGERILSFAVTGGTGEFSDASGTMTLVRNQLVFELGD